MVNLGYSEQAVFNGFSGHIPSIHVYYCLLLFFKNIKQKTWPHQTHVYPVSIYWDILGYIMSVNCSFWLRNSSTPENGELATDKMFHSLLMHVPFPCFGGFMLPASFSHQISGWWNPAELQYLGRTAKSAADLWWIPCWRVRKSISQDLRSRDWVENTKNLPTSKLT